MSKLEIKIMMPISRFDLPQQDKSNLVKQLHFFPAGTSAKTIVHFAQMIVQDRFQAFDWGSEGNIQRYNTSQPPQVNLNKVKPAQAIYVAKVS